MHSFKLTFRPEDIEDIYLVPQDRENLKRFTFYTKPALGFLAVISSFYWFLNEKAGKQVLFGMIALLYGLYLLAQFRKEYVRIKFKMKHVKEFIDKNAGVSSFILDIDETAMTLHLDEVTSVFPFAQLLKITSRPDFLLLDFEESNLLLPAKAFTPADFKKVEDLAKAHEPETTK